MHDRRRHARSPCELPVTFRHAGQVHRGVTEDLGLFGVRILTRVEVPIGAAVEVACWLPFPGRVLQVSGEVRWRKDGAMGVELRDMQPEDIWLLGNFLGRPEASPDEE